MKKVVSIIIGFVLVLSLSQHTLASSFKDVPPSYTFYNEVTHLVNHGIITGFSDGTFKPNQPVTRAQAAIMIGRALDLDGTPRNTKFYDVRSNVTGSGYISSAVEKGIISGFPDGSFRPFEPVTRGQMAIFLDRAYTLKTGVNNSFSDVTPAMSSYQAILNVSANGIAGGYPDGTYRPGQAVTRGQFSAFISRTLKLNDSSPVPETPLVEVSGLVNGSITNESKHQINVETTEGATITVTLNGQKIESNSNLYQIEFKNEGKNVISVTATLNGIKTEKRIEVTYRINNDLSTSEIAELNDSKVVLIEVNTRSGKSQGSGVVVGDGLILTNEHVINGMRDATIHFSNGKKYKIEGVVASDKTKDLALLKTTEQIANVNPVKLGTSKSLQKGEKIVAIGSPWGLQNTVSEGIVSSFRMNDGIQLIQISADIDHGSSGGGLFNVKGELVGITTGGKDNVSANLNFAVAIDEASSWSMYFSMKFADIKVQPIVVETLAIPDFKNIALGMSKQQVKNAETATLFGEDSTTLNYKNRLVFGFSANVTYKFEKDKLVEIYIFHDVVNNQYDLEVLESYFYAMYKELSDIYGIADRLDTDWYDDSDGYILSALWVMNSQDVYLASRINLDYSSYGGIMISIK